ncbi:MAG: peptidoglycan-binding protein [Congregibacter sp.]
MPVNKDPLNACVIPVLVLIVLSACATAPPQNVYNKETFLDGEVVLACDSSACANTWGTRRRAVKGLYESLAWEELAATVTNLQYDNDLAYFYLGRAAQEMDAHTAAQAYFDRANSAFDRCSDGIYNRCNGISIADEAAKRSEESADKIAIAASLDMTLEEAQSKLNQLGLYTAVVDGLPGPRTAAAVTQFQTANGLEETGTLTPETLLALFKTKSSPGINQASSINIATEALQEAPLLKPELKPEPEITQEQEPEPEIIVQQAAEKIPVKTPVAVPGSAVTELGSVAPVAAAAATQPERSLNTENLLKGERTRVKIEIELLTAADPFAEVVVILQQGAWVTIINRGDEWSEISYEDRIGYVYTDNLQ